jgi:hypothetical protein
MGAVGPELTLSTAPVLDDDPVEVEATADVAEEADSPADIVERAEVLKRGRYQLPLEQYSGRCESVRINRIGIL